MVKTIPLKGVSSAKVALQFINHWVFNNGPPVDLLARKGEAFTSKFFQDVTVKWNDTIAQSSPHYELTLQITSAIGISIPTL